MEKASGDELITIWLWLSDIDNSVIENAMIKEKGLNPSVITNTPQPSPNLLTNPGFEEGTDWTPPPAPWVSDVEGGLLIRDWQNGRQNSGTRNATVCLWGDNSSGFIQQTVENCDAGIYTAEVWLKSSWVFGYADMCEFYVLVDDAPAGTVDYLTSAGGNPAYQKFTLSSVQVTQGQDVTVGVRLSYPGGGVIELYIDDFSFFYIAD